MDWFDWLMATFAVGFLGLVWWGALTEQRFFYVTGTEEKWHVIPFSLVFILVSVYSIGVDPLGPVVGAFF
jgi:hypothetical protein